ncbi:MAG: FAD-dependent oxidoreductase [Bacteroidetes bacterium]|nr:FAD-dependent oxidoreductase [Bacteroidota bacterium]
MTDTATLRRFDVETEIRQRRYDVAIVGAGMGGLSAAALLARSGAKVLLLEAIHYPGGCASSYRKADAVFDVGATTFSGIAPGQPLHDLFGRIGPFDGLLPADPPMGIHIDGRMILRHRDREAWIQEAEQAFDRPMRGFWNEVSGYSDAAYEMMSTVPYLPPRSIRETAANIRHVRSGVLRHLPHLFASVASRIGRHGAGSDSFRRFVDAQLLITSQATSARVPFFAGALGLSYPDYPLYSVRGGMIRYARFLEQCATDAGADVVYLQPVRRIERTNGVWTVRTAKGGVVETETVVTDVPVFNLPEMTTGALRSYFEGSVARLRASGVEHWGAFTMYALVEAGVGAGMPLNLQVVLPTSLVSTGSSTLFLSFSHPEDEERAPSGFRTLTVSTHLGAGHPALLAGREYYRQWKQSAEGEILLALRSHVEDLCDMSFRFVQSGTPRTFEKYTGRFGGLVGGIPLDRRVFPFRYPMPTTPFDGLYCLGDTFFPGQGIPGVTLGALALAKRMKVLR